MRAPSGESNSSDQVVEAAEDRGLSARRRVLYLTCAEGGGRMVDRGASADRDRIAALTPLRWGAAAIRSISTTRARRSSVSSPSTSANWSGRSHAWAG